GGVPVQPARHLGAALDVPVQRRSDLTLHEPPPGGCVAAGQQHAGDLWVVAHGRRELADHLLEHARGVCVDHPAVAERAVVGPHRGEVALGEVVLPWRRICHVEVVALDQAVPQAHGRQLLVNLVTHAALADPGPAANQQRLGLPGHACRPRAGAAASRAVAPSGRPAAGASEAAPATSAMRIVARTPITPTMGPPTIWPPLSNMSVADSAVARTLESTLPRTQPVTSGEKSGRMLTTAREAMIPNTHPR